MPTNCEEIFYGGLMIFSGKLASVYFCLFFPNSIISDSVSNSSKSSFVEARGNCGYRYCTKGLLEVRLTLKTTKIAKRPPAKSPYQLSPLELEILKTRIEELLALGHICPSTSPYEAPVLFAKKKDRTLRFCIDYKALNKLTVQNSAPIPQIDKLFDMLQGSAYFSKIDLDMAYHQVHIAPEDIPKTVFNTQFGHFEFMVLTLGFTNAPATFQSLMTSVLAPLLGKGVIVYLDNILI